MPKCACENFSGAVAQWPAGAGACGDGPGATGPEAGPLMPEAGWFRGWKQFFLV